MPTVTELATPTASYDYVIVGGGTAGCVVASRLAEYLPARTVLLLEGGQSDLENDEVLYLQRCINLLGGDLDYDYPIAPQERGNSSIRMSRAKLLGGCSSHNDCVALRPFACDMRAWEKLGVKGWSFDTFSRLLRNLRTNIQVVDPRHRNELCEDWIQSAIAATGAPFVEDFNKAIEAHGNLRSGAGWINCAYYPDDKRRSSASVNYIHPVLTGKEWRPNLTICTDTWVSRVVVGQDKVVAGVETVSAKSGRKTLVLATQETVLCAGAIDTPRLLLLSGIGPRADLEALSIPCVQNVLGVGENLMDHPDTIVIHELCRPPPTVSTMDSDAVLIVRREPVELSTSDEAADLQIHMYALPHDLHTKALGYETPTNGFSMMPNVPRARSRGRLFLRSADPAEKPVLDFRYFTDPESYDEATIVEGIKIARRIAAQPPFSDWIVREVAPGPHVQTDEQISEYGRRAANTVYHPAGTAKMGDLEDAMAVVDSELRVRGLQRLRIADASVFPVLTSLNPMLTVLCVGERAAELIALEAGWKPEAGRL